MTGKTHRVGGMLCCLGGYLLLEKNGMLLGDVNPLLQLTVMYPFALYGSTVSDLDHNWQSSPSKDIVSYGINKALHLTEKFDKGDDKFSLLGFFNAKHRSWQTHSDLFLGLMLWLAVSILSVASSTADEVIIKLISTGLILGIISHLVLDMLTPEGIWSIILVILGRVFNITKGNYKVSLVPNVKFFRTGGAWETIIRYIMWIICFILFIVILFDISPYDISFLKV